MSVISHILSITAPLSHTCTTYRPVVLIKKTTDISSEKMNKRLMSHFQPRGERVQMNEWSVSSLSNHLCNLTSLACAHLCQQQRSFSFFSKCQAVIVLTDYPFSYTASFFVPPPSPFSVPPLPFLCCDTLCDRLYTVSPAGAFDT